MRRLPSALSPRAVTYTIMRLRFAALILCLVWAFPAWAQDNLVQRGEYLLRAGGCVACHTPKGGVYLGGGLAMPTPFGTFHTPGIAAGEGTALAQWSEADFIRALKQGRRPQGGRYYPAFPYTSYAAMTDEDAKAIFAYLRTIPASANAPTPRPHDLRWPFSMRWLMTIWQWLFFEAPAIPMPANVSDDIKRGGYLTVALGHCAECHTPRNAFGALKRGLGLIGTADGPNGERVPNITPAKGSGIGDWTQSELTEFLQTGLKPSFDDVQGSMKEAIEDGLRYLNEADRRAIAAYLLVQPPIDYTPPRKQ